MIFLEKYKIQLVRKFYHLVVVLLFVPAFFLDVDVLRVSMTIVGSLFILLEALRVSKYGSLHIWLTPAMMTFKSELDTGDAILSHFFLLLFSVLNIQNCPMHLNKH